jgi:solute carrier family 25 2-oxodicarboxylate transporter 21
MAGTAAGTVGTILNTPFDVAKSRLQNTKGASPWTLPTLAQVHRLEGARALYKGFVPKVLRLGPGGGILFLVYNKISSIFLSSA